VRLLGIPNQWRRQTRGVCLHDAATENIQCFDSFVYTVNSYNELSIFDAEIPPKLQNAVEFEMLSKVILG